MVSRSEDPKALSRELLRFARSLAQVGEDPEDWAQEAHLRVLERAPEQARNRAYLAKTLYHVAQESRRRRQRRPAVQVSPESAVDSEPDDPEQRKLSTLLHEEIQALRSRQRAVVLARCIRGESRTDVAKHLGLKESEVDDALRAAKKNLRAALDQHFGSNAAWAAIVVPKIRPSQDASLEGETLEASASSGRSADPARARALGVGSLVSPVGLLMGLFLLALAIVPLWLAGVADDSHTAPRGARFVARQEPRPAAPVEITPNAVRAPARPERAEARGNGSAEVSGRVLDPRGRPAHGARVRWLGYSMSRGTTVAADGHAIDWSDLAIRPAHVVVTRETRTDPDGYFRFAGVHAETNGLVTAQLDGAYALRPMARTPMPGCRVDLRAIQLLAAARIRGRVVSDDGVPLHGATVRALDLGLASLLPIGRVHPKARLAIGGRVLALPEWAARFWDALQLPEVLTGPDGEFELEAPFGVPKVIVHAPGFMPWTRRIQLRAGRTEDLETVVLEAGAEIDVRVLQGGREVVGAEIWAGEVTSRWGAQLLDRMGTSDARGMATVRGLAASEALLAIRSAPNQAWTLRRVDMGEPRTIDLELPVDLEVDVLVRTPRRLVGPPKFQLFPAGDVEGRLRIGELATSGMLEPITPMVRKVGGMRWRIRAPKGRYALLVSAAGHEPASTELRFPQVDQSEVELMPIRPFVVQLVDSGGAPVSGADVYVKATQPSLVEQRAVPRGRWLLGLWDAIPHFAGTTGNDGTIAIHGVGKGPVWILARDAKGRTGAEQLPLVPRMRLRLQDPAPLEVRWGGTAGVHGLEHADHHVIQFVPTALPVGFFQIIMAVPEPDGTVPVNQVPPGNYDVGLVPGFHRCSSLVEILALMRRPDLRKMQVVLHGAQAPGRHLLRFDPLRARAGQAATRIEGQAFMNGRPAHGFVVQVVARRTLPTMADTFAGPTCKIGSNGNFRFTSLLATSRKLDVSIRRAAGGTKIASVRVPTAGTRHVLRFDLTTRPVQFTLVDESGTPIPDLELVLKGGEKRAGGYSSSQEVVSDVDGKAALDHVMPGRYRLVAYDRFGDATASSNEFAVTASGVGFAVTSELGADLNVREIVVVPIPR